MPLLNPSCSVTIKLIQPMQYTQIQPSLKFMYFTKRQQKKHVSTENVDSTLYVKHVDGTLF